MEINLISWCRAELYLFWRNVLLKIKGKLFWSEYQNKSERAETTSNERGCISKYKRVVWEDKQFYKIG